MSKKNTKNFAEVCRQFGRTPEDLQKLSGSIAMNDEEKVEKSEKPIEKEVVALADTDLDAEIEALLAEAPIDGDAGVAEITPTEDGPVVEEAVVVEDVTDEMQALVDRLMAVKDNEETSKEDIATAEELLARLEELKAVKENVASFLEEKEAVQEAVEEEVKEEMAEEIKA